MPHNSEAKMAKKSHGAGRPKNEYDLEKVEIFGRFRATYETMADYFGVCVRTIEREMSPSNNPETEFCRYYKKGHVKLKMRLSEAQIHNAIECNNATLQVWLGKQYLGQKDKQEIEQNSNVNISDNRVLETMSDHDLNAINDIYSKYNQNKNEEKNESRTF